MSYKGECMINKVSFCSSFLPYAVQKSNLRRQVNPMLKPKTPVLDKSGSYGYVMNRAVETKTPLSAFEKAIKILDSSKIKKGYEFFGDTVVVSDIEDFKKISKQTPKLAYSPVVSKKTETLTRGENEKSYKNSQKNFLIREISRQKDLTSVAYTVHGGSGLSRTVNKAIFYDKETNSAIIHSNTRFNHGAGYFRDDYETKTLDKNQSFADFAKQMVSNDLGSITSSSTYFIDAANITAN